MTPHGNNSPNILMRSLDDWVEYIGIISNIYPEYVPLILVFDDTPMHAIRR